MRGEKSYLCWRIKWLLEHMTHSSLNRSFILPSEIGFTRQLLLVRQSSVLVTAGITPVLLKVLTENRLKQLPY